MGKRLGVILCVAIGFSAEAKANNNLFLPGDAFFPTILDGKDADQIAASGARPTLFKYASFGGYRDAFCGFAGYGYAQFLGLDEAFVANLRKAYRLIVERDPTLKSNANVRDIDFGTGKRNGVKVLFYDSSFDFPAKFRLGLRYNENWVSEVVKFGHPEDRVRLYCLIDSVNAVTESWRVCRR